MKVAVKAKCPICGKKAECIRFEIDVGNFSKLWLECRLCKLLFEANALGYDWVQKTRTITFTSIASPTKMIWEKKRGFNPSER